VPRWIVRADRTEASPIFGIFCSASAAYRSFSALSGNMPWLKSVPSSHWCPGAISNGPCRLHVDRGDVERQRVEPVLAQDLGLGREVAVPRLVHGAGARDVEADLDDPVVRPEDLLADAGDHGWVTSSSKPRRRSGWIST
jgi:hypothetical protein